MKPALVWKGMCTPKSLSFLANKPRENTRVCLLFMISPRWRACSQAIVFLVYVISIDISTRRLFIKCSQRYKVKASAKFLLTFPYAWQVYFSGFMFFFYLFIQQLRTATGQLTSNNEASFYWTSPELLGEETFGRNTDIWYYFFTNTVEPFLTAPFPRRSLLCPGHLFTFALASL